MSLQRYAKALGKRGGKERARRLSAQKRREIASLGAQARFESLQAAKRIEENFRYLETVRQMRSPHD